MRKDRSGFFTVVVGEEPIYEGYFLKGKPFVVKAQKYGEVWYRGLLSEEEYQNNLMGNPFEYAHRVYGDRYVRHMDEFARRIMNRAKGDFGEENLRFIFRELPEEHVRLVLGLTADDEGGTERGEGLIDGIIKRLGCGRVWVGEEAKALLGEIQPKRADSLTAFVYPHYLMLVGSVKSEKFVVLTSRLESIDLMMEWDSNGESEDEPERFKLETFSGVGVPFARIKVKGNGVASLRIYRRIGTIVRTEVDVPLSVVQIKRVVEEYRTWVRFVESEVQLLRPSHITLPAWRKMIMAYLDEYPNPEDFARILTVETGLSVEVPTVRVTGSQEFDHSGSDRTFTTLE